MKSVKAYRKRIAVERNLAENKIWISTESISGENGLKLRVNFWIILFISPLICITVGIISFIILIDGNRSCFGTLIPTQADVAQNGWVNFPPSATNISWSSVGFQCIASIRFDMKPEDLKPFLTAMHFDEIVFTEHEDGKRERNDPVIVKGNPLLIENISTRYIFALRGNERFNQNVSIDRHSPEMYHVRIVSNQWPYSTTRRFSATPGWFSNSITPVPTE